MIPENIQELEIINLKEYVRSFKYLDVTIDGTNNIYEEIKIRTTTANKCYYSLAYIFKSKRVSLNIKSHYTR